MSAPIYINPEKRAPFDPSIGDSRNSSWISPTDVPQRIFLKCDPGMSQIRFARFEYPVDEEQSEPTDLDERDDPPIRIRQGKYSGKLIEMTFGRPIAQSDLPRIAERLEKQASGIRVMSTMFNYQMIARILAHLLEVTESTEKPSL
jgi:hypothetical protein